MAAPRSPERPFLRVAYGDQELEFMVQPWFDVDVPEQGVNVAGEHDVLIAGLGAPRDATLYGALGVAIDLLGRRPPLRAGGALVLPARLDEGAGEGDLEERVALLRERCLVIVAASEAPEAVRLAGLRAAVDVEEALEIAFEHVGRPQRASVLVIERVAGTPSSAS